MQQKWIHYLWEKQFLQILTIGVRSTLLSSSNRNANTMQFSVLLNWCMALNEFIAGSAIIASIHCCGNPHCFSSEGHIPLNRSGLLLHPYEASSTRNKCICPTNSEVWFFFFSSDVWGCSAEFRDSYFWFDKDNRRKLAPRNICLSLVLVVISHGSMIGQGNVI